MWSLLWVTHTPKKNHLLSDIIWEQFLGCTQNTHFFYSKFRSFFLRWKICVRMKKYPHKKTHTKHTHELWYPQGFTHRRNFLTDIHI